VELARQRGPSEWAATFASEAVLKMLAERRGLSANYWFLLRKEMVLNMNFFIIQLTMRQYGMLTDLLRDYTYIVELTDVAKLESAVRCLSQYLKSCGAFVNKANFMPFLVSAGVAIDEDRDRRYPDLTQMLLNQETWAPEVRRLWPVRLPEIDTRRFMQRSNCSFDRDFALKFSTTPPMYNPRLKVFFSIALDLVTGAGILVEFRSPDSNTWTSTKHYQGQIISLDARALTNAEWILVLNQTLSPRISSMVI